MELGENGSVEYRPATESYSAGNDFAGVPSVCSRTCFMGAVPEIGRIAKRLEDALNLHRAPTARGTFARHRPP